MAFLPQQLTVEDWQYLYNTTDPSVLLDPNLLSFNGVQETLCVGNSLDQFNSAFQTLTSGLGADSISATNESLMKYAFFWNDLYSRFIEVSASIMQATLLVEQYHQNWISASSTTTAMSSYWTTPFSITYPRIQTINPDNPGEWDTLTQNVSSWLRQNFLTIDYPTNQIIFVQILFQETLPASITIKRSTYVKCASKFVNYRVGCNGSCWGDSWGQSGGMTHYDGGYGHCGARNSGDLEIIYVNTIDNTIHSQPDLQIMSNPTYTRLRYNDRRKIHIKTITKLKTIKFIKPSETSPAWNLLT